MEIIDLSYDIINDMPVYPGDTNTILIQEKFLINDKYNNHRLSISMHSGTHIDGPMHLTESKQYISQLPLKNFIGNGILLDVRNQEIIRFKEEFNNMIEENSIVLLYTGFDKFYGKSEYYENHPVIDQQFCDFLINKKIKMLGMDTPSPDKYPFYIHKTLFEYNIFILENLKNLDKLVSINKFEVIALPLKINADSSMTRAIARIL